MNAWTRKIRAQLLIFQCQMGNPGDIHIQIHTYIHTYICVYLLVCVCDTVQMDRVVFMYLGIHVSGSVLGIKGEIM